MGYYTGWIIAGRFHVDEVEQEKQEEEEEALRMIIGQLYIEMIRFLILQFTCLETAHKTLMCLCG